MILDIIVVIDRVHNHLFKIIFNIFRQHYHKNIQYDFECFKICLFLGFKKQKKESFYLSIIFFLN